MSKRQHCSLEWEIHALYFRERVYHVCWKDVIKKLFKEQFVKRGWNKTIAGSVALAYSTLQSRLWSVLHRIKVWVNKLPLWNAFEPLLVKPWKVKQDGLFKKKWNLKLLLHNSNYTTVISNEAFYVWICFTRNIKQLRKSRFFLFGTGNKMAFHI